MGSREVGEFNQHYMNAGHWQKDAKYRVLRCLVVYNTLREPLELNARQLAEYGFHRRFEHGIGYPFNEGLIHKYSRVESRVLFLTLVSCLTELLRKSGVFQLLRRLWDHFCASLSDGDSLYNLKWTKCEALKS